jgi:hypothetical protein
MPSKSLRDQLITGFVSAIVLVGALASTHPIYMARTAVVQALFTRDYIDSTTIRAPWLLSSSSVALRTPQFLADRQAFVDDLLQTGKVHAERAWQIADVAVREAYTRRVPPALVLGVMLT